MKSGGPWNLRGLRPEAREAARTAARRSSMSVGEWLNDVIEPDDEDDEIALFADDDQEDDEVEYERSRRSRRRHRERRRARADRQAQQQVQQQQVEFERRVAKADRRQVQRQVEFERRVAQADRRHAEREDAFDREVVRTRSEIGAVSDRLERLSQQMERMASRAESAARRRPVAPPPPPPRQRPPFNGDQNHDARLTGAPASPRRSASERLAALPPAPAADNDSLSIDEAVAEIRARQRVLDGHAAPEPAVQLPPKPTAPAAAAPVEAAPAPAPMVQAAAPAPAPMPVAEPEPMFHYVPEPPVIDISGLEQQLRQITARIEGLKPSSDLENTVAAIRADLTEIAHLITEALPRCAVESLEIEVKALGQRIEDSRQCGVDTAAISGLERGLSEVRQALHGLTPAENLVGFEDAVRTLSQKVDIILAKEDPAALQQLETAIGALRGIVSHVASNETLTKVAEDVRALSATVDSFANSAASGRQISALENRIEALATALTASSEAGHAVPRELDKLLSGLIEKLEWVQLTHTDHAALAHLEDRIATLVQRFDASEAKFNHLEAVERGLVDLLVHLDQIRGVAEIKQSELRTQDSLEAVPGAVEQVADRLAMIESGIREQAQRAAVLPPQPVAAVSAPPAPPAPAAAPAPAPVEHTPQRVATARKAIDPSLPPDHPLEPGSRSGRSRSTPSAADRIAASEAAVSAAKPPVIADPGKSNFIAAARRAAQAAAATAPATAVVEKGATASAAKPRRVRPLILAGAAALIVVGCLQIAPRMFVSGGAPAPQPAVQEPEKTVAPPVTTLPQSEPPAVAAQPERAPTPAPVPAPMPAPMLITPPNAAPMPDPAPPANNPKTGDATLAKPVHQSAASLPAALAAAAAANSDVTGSLPRAAATAPLGDKLPAAIGGSALRAAALSGNSAAAYEIAMRFAEGRGVTLSNEEAALWLERAAKSGLVPAQFRVGGFYEKGIGVKKNLVTARDFYLAAAAKGNGKAMHNLAVLYAEGVDGTPDYPNAAHWFREAADHGVTDSQYNLGILYARGTGVAQNYAESYKWFALGAAAGDQDAAKKAEEVASRLDRQSLAAAQLAVKTFTAIPQPDDAINVKAPAGGWDTTASAPPAAKPKPQTPGVKAAAQNSKVN